MRGRRDGDQRKGDELLRFVLGMGGDHCIVHGNVCELLGVGSFQCDFSLNNNGYI